MQVVTGLRGFGQLPARTSGGGSSGIPKSDYIKQLQCLLNIIVQTPEAVSRFQRDKELWALALAWGPALPNGLPVSGYYRTSWPTEADAIVMLSRAGLPEFAAIDSAITPQSVDANLLSYIQSSIQFMQRSIAYADWAPNVAACDFPGQTAARLDAERAAAEERARIAEEQARVAAEAEARRQAEAVAKAAAEEAVRAAQAAQVEAAMRAAEVAAAAAQIAQTEAAHRAAEQAAQAAQAAAAAQQQASSSSTPPSLVTPPSANVAPPNVQPLRPLFSFAALPRNSKLAIGAGLLIAVAAAGTAYGVRRARAR